MNAEKDRTEKQTAYEMFIRTMHVGATPSKCMTSTI